MDVAAVKGGRVIDSRRITMKLPNEPTAWAKELKGCTESLKRATEELGVKGARARVVYRSPSQAIDLASFELRSAAQACAAAVLPAAEQLPYSISAACIEAAVVGRDRSGSERRWHVVVAADRIDVVRNIVALVEAAELKFESATPVDAAIMAALVRRALRFAGPRHGWLHFGKFSSFFILGGEGCVRFERSIGLGVETIVQSLTRPIRMPDRDDPLELQYDTAKEIVHKHGIPADDEVVHDELKLSRQQIMPLIQPVLQRYVVELRQSLRFGLAEEDREAIEVTVSGPGSAIPGLADLIAWELKLHFTADPHYAGYDYQDPATKAGELVEAIADQSFLNLATLQPPEVAQRRRVSRLKRWLWAGATAALVVLGADAFHLESRISHAQAEANTLKTANDEAEMLEKTHRRLVNALEAMTELERNIAREIGARANLRAVFQELSRVTPESIKLNSVRINREEGKLTARLYGRADEVDETQGRTELEPYIDAIKSSPIFRNAILRNVEVGSTGGSASQRFEATFEIVLAPNAAGIETVAARTKGNGP